MGIVLVLMLLSTACGSVERTEHIESFTIENSEKQDNGMFEVTGYKKVNSVSLIEESDNHMESDVKMVEDYYNSDGIFLKSIFTYGHGTLSKLTRATDSDEQKLELSEPSTILAPDLEGDNFKGVELTAEEKVRVKEHVLSFMED
ncbi:hypothetical protein [Paenibacillus sp. HB172176]|uniref:hypothetical protein n=1 Tax=Paenibacillus sp. HB172176 TaxID=2493690 RepID=UPI00143AC049|nr:hypothetical protein [Paenibacillus sp. HB172176]